MIYQLDPRDYAKARPVFKGLQDRVAVQATIEGDCPGQIFVDDAGNPSAVFTWNEFRYSYLAGDPSDVVFIAALKQLLDEKLLPQARDSHDPTLVLYPYPTSWEEKIETLVSHRPIHRPARKTFTFEAGRFQGHDWRDDVPSGFQMQRIDEDVLARGGREITTVPLTFWRSTDAFLTKGVGFCLLRGDEIVSACLAAFAGGNRREISVDTHPAYRRQGFATLAASAFVAHCLENGLEPVWECWADNVPSVGLAEKLGFLQDVDYPVYFVDLKPHAKENTRD